MHTIICEIINSTYCIAQGNYTYYLIVTCNRRECTENSVCVYIYIPESLCCKLETNTNINYVSIKICGFLFFFLRKEMFTTCRASIILLLLLVPFCHLIDHS